MKILLHIRSLDIGGSERQVISLAKSMAEMGVEVHVALISRGGSLEIDLENTVNIHIYNVGGPSLLGRIRYLIRLRSLIKSENFDAVYGFLPTPNLALLVALSIRNRPVIAWGIRSSGLDLTQYGSKVKWAMRIEKWFSRFPDKIFTNSQAGLQEYRDAGYPHSKLHYIPNAIEVKRFKPNPPARNSVRHQLGILDSAPLIGLFARIHPMKDHLTFLRAIKILINERPDARFICAGGGSLEYSTYETFLKSATNDLGLDDCVLWLGARNDPEVLMAACDVTTLTSNNGEGFPNSVAESMACGIPCIPTDIGDSSDIVRNFVQVVPPNNPEVLAKAWKSTLDQDQAKKSKISIQIRESIIERFSSSNIAETVINALGVRA